MCMFVPMSHLNEGFTFVLPSSSAPSSSSMALLLPSPDVQGSLNTPHSLLARSTASVKAPMSGSLLHVGMPARDLSRKSMKG